MSKWKNISLFKFQQIEAINNTPGYDELGKVLSSACIIFDMTEHELDNKPMSKVSKIVAAVTRVFNSPFEPRVLNSIGAYQLNFDIPGISFGQYIELSFFLQSHIGKAHYALASISSRRFGKYKTEGHWKRAEYFLYQPAELAIGCLKALMEKFVRFNQEYNNLFGLDQETHEPEVQGDRFNRRYGWTYSASCVAEYERITLDQAFALPVRQALNDLAYLKEKANYEARERDKIMRQQKM